MIIHIFLGDHFFKKMLNFFQNKSFACSHFSFQNCILCFFSYHICWFLFFLRNLLGIVISSRYYLTLVICYCIILAYTFYDLDSRLGSLQRFLWSFRSLFKFFVQIIVFLILFIFLLICLVKLGILIILNFSKK